MAISRRNFVVSGGIAAVGIGISPLRSQVLSAATIRNDQAPDLLPEGEMLDYAAKAVESAVAAGASYADARLYRNVKQKFEFEDNDVVSGKIADGEVISMGVRVLYRGAWGFAASPFPDMEEAVLLSKSAIEQAQANSAAKPMEIEWSAAPAYKGRWISPGIDPFVVPLEERVDFFNSWRNEVKEYRDGKNYAGNGDAEINFQRQESFLVTSEGTRVSQVRYICGAGLVLGAKDREIHPLTGPHGVAPRGINTQLGGWEIFTNAKMAEQIPRLVEESALKGQIGVMPVDIGRYSIVMDGAFAGNLLGATFGRATHLDIALGFEANSIGTSYLGPNPLDFLGTKVAHPSINIKADRSGEKKLGTVEWDEEGIKPQTFDLVKDGILVDYQTSRENVSYLKDWYSKTGKELKPQGLSTAASALNIQQQTSPNLELVANSQSNSFEAMVSEVEKGYAIIGGGAQTSFNMREGTGSSREIREIRNGKLGNFVRSAAIMFSTPDIWSQIEKIGDASTKVTGGYGMYKGQPYQESIMSVDAPALLVKEIPVIDATRKA